MQFVDISPGYTGSNLTLYNLFSCEVSIISFLQQNVNKKIWDGFDEEFFRAEEDFYAHKYNFAENGDKLSPFSILQRKVNKIAFEFGLGAGVVDTEISNLHNVAFTVFGKSGKLTSDKNPYAQHVDKYSLGGKLGEIVGWLNEHGYEDEAQAVAVCGSKTNAVDIRCRAEHRFAKQIFCGRQYCPRCGEKESVIHQQRYFRSWDRLMYAPALGKVVLTIPEELRDNFKSADMLGKLHRLGWQCVKEVWGRDILMEKKVDGKIEMEVEKGIDIDGAMTNFHVFGDRKDRNKFHPHINVTFPLCPGIDLVDEEGKAIRGMGRKALWVSKERLEALRDKWYDMLEKLTGKTISLTEDGRERKNAHYGFRVTDAQKAHWLKYVLRPTVGAERFLEQDDDFRKFIATLLVGFHNVRWYGKLSNRMFPKYRKEYLENTSFYQKFLAKKQGRKVRDFKYCPICHGQLKVHKHKGKVEILEGIHKTWHELSPGFWCDEVTYQILVRKGLVGANGKFIDSS